jgi:hypothetical protein
MPASSDERDRGERLFCDIGGVTIGLQSQDLDAVGLFVPTDKPPELDRELDLRLLSPIGELRLKAHIVQVVSVERARREQKRPGCAMVFIGLSDEQRAWISLTRAALGTAPGGKPSLRTVPRVLSGPARARAASQVAMPAVPTPQQPPAATMSAQQAHWNEQKPQIRERLRKELAAIDGKAPCEILCIARDADAATAKRAFLTMSKRYHPHAFARFDCAEISALATQLFIAHKRAYGRMTSLRPPSVSIPTLSGAPKAFPDSKRPRGGNA